jgi:hypothetical protein
VTTGSPEVLFALQERCFFPHERGRFDILLESKKRDRGAVRSVGWSGLELREEVGTFVERILRGGLSLDGVAANTEGRTLPIGFEDRVGWR